jgi:cation transport ATPase
MQELTGLELQQTLQDLSTSTLTFKKLNAARKLGELSVSSEEIVRALAVAASLDDEVQVRNAAMQALLSPAHQTFIKDRPDFIQEATKSALQGQEKEREKASQKIEMEFLRRRTWERVHILLIIAGLILPQIIFMIGVNQNWMQMWMVRLWVYLYVVFVILVGFLSWRNWRCPSCDSWLGGFRFSINAIWSPSAIKCPHCGVKLI